MQNELRSFRDRVASEHEVQSETMKLQHRAEMSERFMRKSEHELARLQIRIEEKDRYIDKLKKDLERVFEELKKCKK